MTGKRKAFKRFFHEIFSDELPSQGTSAPSPSVTPPEVHITSFNPIAYQNASTAIVSAVQSAPNPPAPATTPITAPRADNNSRAPQPANTAASNTTQEAPTAPISFEATEYKGWTGLKLFARVLSRTPESFGPLKHAADVLVGFIGTFETAAENDTEWQKLKSQLDTLFGDISKYVDSSTPLTMTGSIENLQQGIKKEIEFIEQVQKRSDALRYLTAEQGADDVFKCYRRIEDLFRRLTLNADMETWKTVKDLATHTYLKNLPNSEAAYYRSADSSRLNRNGCTKNTRVDILQELRDWAGGATPEKIYWLNGMAGTGKTTIAYTLCKRLEEEKTLAASFFCSRQLPECRNVNRIVPTLAYQLAYYSDPFRHIISPLLKADPKMYNKPIVDQFRELIVEPVIKVKASLPTDLVIVVDALDECEVETGTADILDVLLAHASGLPLKFFVSSRPDKNIISRLQQTQGDGMKAEMRLHELASPVVQGDIRTYLRTALESCTSISEAQIDTLVERSGVLFIYASTVARYVTSPTSNAKRAKRLGEVLDVSGTNTNESTRGIDELYISILNAAYNSKDLNQSDRDEILLVLHTVMCASEPLSANTMASLLKLDDEQTVQDALSPLLSILRISKYDVITTLHESFRDFLFDSSRSGRFHCNAAEHNARLAQLCFDKIREEAMFNIANLESSYVFDETVSDLDKRVREVISKALLYACCHWDTHLSQANSHEGLAGPLFDFLSESLLAWIEIMNLKCLFGYGIRMLYDMKELSQNFKAIGSESKRLLEDGWRFMSTHASTSVVQSTPHIYISALLFWPDMNPVSQHYASIGSNIIGEASSAMELRSHRPVHVMENNGIVRCVRYSPNGKHIASALVDRNIYLWDAHTGQKVGQSLQGHTSSVSSVAYSHDGTHIVSGSHDRTVRIWDARTGQQVGLPLKGHTGWISSVAYSHNSAHIVSGSSDNTVRVWDTDTGQQVGLPLNGHTDSVYSVAYSHNGAYIVSGSHDKTVRIWDAHTGQQVGQPLKGHTSTVYSVAYSHDSSYIVSGSKDYTVRIWDARTGQKVGRPLKGHTSSVNSVAYSHDSAHIVSGSSDMTVRIWDARTGRQVGQPLRGHASPVYSVAYSHDSAYIVSGSHDKTMRTWDVLTGQQVSQPLNGHTSPVYSVACSHDSAHIVSGSNDETVRIWDARTGQQVGQPLKGHTDSVYSVAYSHDSACIVSGSSDETVRIWDAHTGLQIGQPLKGHTDSVNSVAYSHDSAYIVSGSDDNTVRIWDARTGQQVGQPLEGHTDSVYSVAYSHDSACIVSGSRDFNVRIWDARTGQQVGLPLNGHIDSVYSVAYSHDSAYIVSGSKDFTVRIWDARTGANVGQPLKGHASPVYSVAYSHDSAYIVSGSNDKTVRIWDAHTGQQIGQPLKGHANSIFSVAYSHDSSYIVSGSDDETVRIWDARTGQQVAQSPKGHAMSVRSFGHLQQRPDSEGNTARHGATVLLPDDVSSHVCSSSCNLKGYHRSWTLNDDGWIVLPTGELLLWVPSDLHHVLAQPQNRCIASSRYGALYLKFDQFVLGHNWAKYFNPSKRAGSKPQP
ncbi:WD repeat-containing protein [Ceratobasidium sp. AG-Ba]|nr:WD repeat-containing protein [Ceratobasidium sp. AG-Ba]